MREDLHQHIYQDARRNRLLSALPEAILSHWGADFVLVDLELGQVLYEVGQTPGFAYFPVNTVVSILYVMENGASAEIAIVGNEGVVGVSLFMGGGATSSRAVVQNAGLAFRLPASALVREFDRGGPVLTLLLRYTQALMAQMTQTAACNRHHTLQQQLCRWMLLSLDRLEGNELTMTQQLIANMLGITVDQVTETATDLTNQGLINYCDGTIMVRDRKGVEAKSCECYRVVKKEYDRLLVPA